ncbi:hypothetical protein PPL_05058 [Heterostelium album PN500]|uniref:Uncharacterized protein n=1 Tax=Heterostelium pallidum (strain ATCC 26659 / Pp 5 / PN500) TaxID=670386 RepID=D3B9B4_HETP5|nr:hypothetical protein PPL_05058 [Heterostelium album PN500]EFA81826.1 hypothetical protein PPL_05058 [Heterostelium album PN500]|eukprot:XP_020433943.1 hypothetical protein PPL_05058 [Heterostelium album PN500]
MSNKPPIYIMLAAQLLSVVGDSFGQRVSRVNFKHSPRHMMIGLCLMTAIQMFVIFSILQLSLPTSISGAIYINSTKVDCFYQLDVEGKIEDCTVQNCTEIPCKSQGPFSMFRSMKLHPFLFANGAFNIIYYNGEVLLYKEPLGLLFLVIAALSSTFLINPLNKIFGEPINQPIPPLIYIFGILGSLLSVIEFTPKPLITSKDQTESNDKDTLLDKNDSFIEQEYSEDKKVIEEKSRLINDSPADQDSPQQKKDAKYWLKTVGNVFLRSLRILIPMLLLMLANAIWMETSLFYNDQFRVNAFGYNSIDQVLLPFYLFPFMLIVDFIPPLKKLFLTEDDAKENMLQAVKGTWKETKYTGLITLFMYRFLINARAIIYFYLAIEYDLTLVYLELTLIRVVLNWLGAVILNLIVPKFIDATAEERRKTFYPINIVLKCLGTGGVVASLIILNK